MNRTIKIGMGDKVKQTLFSKSDSKFHLSSIILHAKGFESVKVIIKLAERVVFLPSHVLFGF